EARASVGGNGEVKGCAMIAIIMILSNCRSKNSQTSKAYIVLNKETMRIEESLNVTFDESLPEPKSCPLVEDDRIIEPVVQDLVRSSSLEANASEPGYLNSVKEARGHPIEQVIDPCLGTKGSNDLCGARVMISILYLYKDINLQMKDQDPTFFIGQKGEKERKEQDANRSGEKASIARN
ncbi:hypothetical protein Tco_0641154, partial [Tanacetum coccineum]